MIHNILGRSPLVKLATALAAAATLVLLATDVGGAAAITEYSGAVSLSGTQTVEPGEVLRFDPDVDTTVEISGNLVVEGVLEMKPKPGVSHTLRFTGVDEEAFVGGGMEVLESDRGLWVMGAGRLDIVGEKKAGWNRTGSDPTWKSSDTLRVAPVGKDDFGRDGFKSFQMGDPVPRADSSLPPAEVINLTRSVHIEGTPGGRSHMVIISSEPQTIRYADFRYMGPRQSIPEGSSEGVAGRYPIHFHHSGDGARGSIVEGNVIRNSGNRAIVPHASHGVVLRDNVAYNVMGTAYWWDPGVDNASHDSEWIHNFAGYVQNDPPTDRGFSMAGFMLGRGDRNVANENAAAGILGTKNCSGFHWPSSGAGLWEFQDNVAHNSNCDGIRVWENSSANHIIDDFVAYRNQLAGIDHGAYTNNYIYSDLYLFENGEVGIIDHAFSHGDHPERGMLGQSWSCVTVVGSPVAVQIAPSSAPQDGDPAEFNNLVAIDTPVLFDVTQAALDKGQTLAARATLNDIGVKCTGDTVHPGFGSANRFVDDDGDTHEGFIEAIAAKGITKGCNPPVNDHYCPEDEVTRGQMAAFLVRALDLPAAKADHFIDDNASTFEDDINRLAAAEITKGCNPPNNDRFCPDDTVTRGQMAAFLVRALHLGEASVSDRFIDDNTSTFEDDIDSLGESGITKGCNPPTNDRFCPEDFVLRNQMASFLGRALGLTPIKPGG